MRRIFKAPITKHAAEKAPIEKQETLPLELINKTASSMEKEAFAIPQGAKDVALQAGKTLAISGATVLGGVAATGLANAVFKGINHMVDKPKFEASFNKAVAMDPKLQSYNPQDLRRYAELILEASPSVALNPLLLSNYLRYLTDYQGSMNLTGYKQLADLEGQLLNNREKMKPVTGIAQKALIENTIKGIVEGNKPQRPMFPNRVQVEMI